MSAEREPGVQSPLEKVLRRIRRTEDFPTISKYITEINKKISDTGVQSSASELANIILKDYSLTNKLLKLVNSAFYGFVSGKVTTVTRAVVLLGYDNVRLASLSLLLFEHFKSKSAARELKDATIRSFWCGLTAKEIAKTKHNIDPEEAFICALLHQLGKLLIIYHLPEEYQKIKDRISRRDQKEIQAATQVLGISYHSLGLAVAEQWNFPGSLSKTMTPLTSESLADERRRIDPLCAVANFSNDLARIVGRVPLNRRDAAVERLMTRYQHYIKLSPEQLSAFMESCLEKLHEHAQALQFSVGESDFLMRLSGARPEKEPAADRNPPHNGGPAPPAQGEPLFRLAGTQEIDAGAPFAEEEDAVSIIMGGLQEVSGAMMGKYNINDIALMSLEVIYRALTCKRAILFIHEGRHNVMEARFGYGAGIQGIVEQVKFKMGCDDAPDLFSQALRMGKDLIVEDVQAESIAPLIPSWYRRNIDARAFIFMPIVYQNICVGAYYADVDVAGTPVNALEHKYLSMLRNQMILGIKLSR
jgi:HD-like signal output (HDOD) protein